MTWGLSLGLVVLVGGGAALALQACGLRVAFVPGACAGDTADAARSALVAATARGDDLTARVLAAERELARLQCTAAAADPYRPLDPLAWAARDPGALYGCWALDSTYATRDVETDEVITYGTWQMCFDGQGQGQQVMRGSDGTDCTGPLSAAFAGDGRLMVTEAGDLACADGGFIHRRDIACALGADLRLDCATLQPETGGEAGIGMSKMTRPL
jgi:hypothetical protein